MHFTLEKFGKLLAFYVPVSVIQFLRWLMIDPTAKLPDEILSHALSWVSLSDKLRLERVNKKFQRCVIVELRASPQPLELNGKNGTLNGHKVPQEQLLGAVKALAKRAKFDSINFEYESSFAGIEFSLSSLELLSSILHALISSENNCLSKVKTYQSNVSCSQSLLQTILDKCGKLSTLKLEFLVHGPLELDNDWSNRYHGPIDLGELLKDRALKEIEIRLSGYEPEDLLRIFEKIKPGSVRNIYLKFFAVTAVTALINQLSGSAWSALEKMHLHFQDSLYGSLDDLFASLSHLPALRLCVLTDDKDVDEMAVDVEELLPSIISLFNTSVRTVSFLYLCADGLSGCMISDLIVQFDQQNQHPGIQVHLHRMRHQFFGLTIGLDGMSFTIYIVSESEQCVDAHCVHCRHFYRNVMMALGERLTELGGMSGQLDGYQLHESRVGSIVDDLNACNETDGWEAKSMMPRTL